MRRLASVVAVLALTACNDKPATSTASASAAPKEIAPRGAVTFTQKPMTVGMKRRESGAMTMKMSMSVDPGNGQPMTTSMTMADTNVQTRELLAMNGDTATKVKASFDTIEQRMVEDGKEKTKPSRIAGKTYVVEAKDGNVEVRDDKGALAPKDEAAEVAKHFRSLGKPDPVASVLPGSVKPGEKLPAVAKSLQDYMALSTDGMTVSDVDVVFKETQGDDGVFTLAMKMAKADAQMALTIDLSGEMRVSTTTKETTKIVLGGPMKIAPSPSGKMKIDGSGSMSLEMSLTSP